MNELELADALCQSVAELRRPLVIAISGAAALGKSTLARTLAERLRAVEGDDVVVLSTDGFLMDRNARTREQISGYDPAAMDLSQLTHAIDSLVGGIRILAPTYNHRKGTVLEDAAPLAMRDVLIVEGIHSLEPRILQHVDRAIFLEADRSTSIRLRSRVDKNERGYEVKESRDGALVEYAQYERHVSPSSESAHIRVRVVEDWQYSIDGEAP